MIQAMCEFDSIAAVPEGPEIWIELSEVLDRLACVTPNEELSKNILSVASDTVERQTEAIECYGRSLHANDVDDAQHRTYQATLDAMVCLQAVRDMDEYEKASLMHSLALVAAELRGLLTCRA